MLPYCIPDFEEISLNDYLDGNTFALILVCKVL